MGTLRYSPFNRKHSCYTSQYGTEHTISTPIPPQVLPPSSPFSTFKILLCSGYPKQVRIQLLASCIPLHQLPYFLALSIILSPETTMASFSLPIRLRPKLFNFDEKPTIFDYELDPDDFQVPSGIRIPPHVRQDMYELECYAQDMIDYVKRLVSLREDRFLWICPHPNSEQYKRHARSVELLFLWKDQWNINDPTLYGSAKIPTAAISMAADRVAYEIAGREYKVMVAELLTAGFQKWRKACNNVVYNAHQLMCNPRSLRFNNVGEFSAFSHWHKGSFMSAMCQWEGLLGDLSLPEYSETLGELSEMIRARVENGESLARRLSAGLE